MRAFLAELGNLGIIVFTISSMLAFGLVPLLAVAVLRLFDFGEPYRTGLLLASFAAGAAFTIKVVEVAKKDIAMATTLLLVLLPATIGANFQDILAIFGQGVLLASFLILGGAHIRRGRPILCARSPIRI